MKRWLLVTRREDEIDDLQELLRPLGIRAVAFPVLRERAFDDAAGWQRVESALSTITWVAFTSVRAPEALTWGAGPRGLGERLAALPAAAVGQATTLAAGRAGFHVEVTGDGGGARLAALLASCLRPGDAVLHACGREHREELADGLRSAGADVIPVAVYAMEETPAAELPALPEGEPLAVVVSSPRAALAYLSISSRRFAGVRHIAFGPTTAAALEGKGLSATVLPRPTVHCIVEDVCRICS